VALTPGAPVAVPEGHCSFAGTGAEDAANVGVWADEGAAPAPETPGAPMATVTVVTNASAADGNLG